MNSKVSQTPRDELINLIATHYEKARQELDSIDFVDEEIVRMKMMILDWFDNEGKELLHHIMSSIEGRPISHDDVVSVREWILMQRGIACAFREAHETNRDLAGMLIDWYGNFIVGIKQEINNIFERLN